MAGSNNIQLVDKSSNLLAFVSKDPAAFNGTINAIEELQDITERGIDRVINAINGSYIAQQKSEEPNSDKTKGAVLKAVARELHQSASIAPIEQIQTEELKDSPALSREPKKPRSINAAKALSGFKPDRTEFYQHDETHVHNHDGDTDSRVYSSNNANSVQSNEDHSTSNTQAGGSETVFNQLNSSSTGQNLQGGNENTQNISNNSLSTATSHAQEIDSNESAANSTLNQNNSAIQKTEQINAIETSSHSTENSNSSSTGGSRSKSVRSERHAHSSTEQPESNYKRKKSVSIGKPSFDFAPARDSENKTVERHTSESANNSQTDKSSVTAGAEAKNSHFEKELINGVNRLTESATSATDSTTRTAEQLSSVQSSVSELSDSISKHADTVQSATSETDKQSVSNADRVSTAHTENNNTESKAQANTVSTSDSAIQSIESDSSKSEKESKFSSSNYYKDSNNRLRHKTGRFASKSENNQYNKEITKSKDKKPSVLSKMGKHITSKNGRKLIGTAFMGSGYLAIEEAIEKAQSAKQAAQKRGLTSAEGIKKYASEKQREFYEKTEGFREGARNVAGGSASAVKNIAQKIFGSKDSINNESMQAGDSSIVSSNTSTSAASKSDANSAVSNSVNTNADAINNANATTINQSSQQLDSINVSNQSNQAESPSSSVAAANDLNVNIASNDSTSNSVSNSNSEASTAINSRAENSPNTQSATNTSTTKSDSVSVSNATANTSKQSSSHAGDSNTTESTGSIVTSESASISPISVTENSSAVSSNTNSVNRPVSVSQSTSASESHESNSAAHTGDSASVKSEATTSTAQRVDATNKNSSSMQVNGGDSATIQVSDTLTKNDSKSSVDNDSRTVAMQHNAKPSTVDGFNNSTNISSSDTKESSAIVAMTKYLSAGKAKHQKPSRAINALNSVSNTYSQGSLIGVRHNQAGASDKLRKEYHEQHMAKLAELIKAVEDVSVNVSGGSGGGSLLGDLLDFGGGDDSRRKRGKGRKTGKLGRLKDAFRSSRFFGGGTRVAGALGAGSMFAGGIDMLSGAADTASSASAAGKAGAAGRAGSMGAAGKAASASKFGVGALGGVGRMASKAIPLLAIASTAYDAYEGFTNTDKQREAFNLKSTETPNLGHKSSMGLASVLDLGGITSGAAGLIGDGLGALGFDGAKEALQFDSGDIAKAIYSKGENIMNNGSNLFSSIAEGDILGAGNSAVNLFKELNPFTSLFGSTEAEKREKVSESATSTNNNTINNNSSSDVKSIKESESNSSASAKETIKTQNANNITQSSFIATAQQQSPLQKITDIDTIAASKTTDSVTAMEKNSGKPDVHVLAENREQIALLNRIAKQLEINRNTEQSNNARMSTGINSIQHDVPKQFSDPLMENLANE